MIRPSGSTFANLELLVQPSTGGIARDLDEAKRLWSHVVEAGAIITRPSAEAVRTHKTMEPTPSAHPWPRTAELHRRVATGRTTAGAAA